MTPAICCYEFCTTPGLVQLELEKPPVFGVLPVLDGSSRHSRLQLLSHVSL